MTKQTIKKATKPKKHDSKTSKSGKHYPSTASLSETPQPQLTLDILNSLIQNELPTIKNIDIDAITAKIEGIKETELGKLQQKNKKECGVAVHDHAVVASDMPQVLDNYSYRIDVLFLRIKRIDGAPPDRSCVDSVTL